VCVYVCVCVCVVYAFVCVIDYEISIQSQLSERVSLWFTLILTLKLSKVK